MGHQMAPRIDPHHVVHLPRRTIADLGINDRSATALMDGLERERNGLTGFARNLFHPMHRYAGIRVVQCLPEIFKGCSQNVAFPSATWEKEISQE